MEEMIPFLHQKETKLVNIFFPKKILHCFIYRPFNVCVCVCVCVCTRQSGGGAARLLLTHVHLNHPEGTLPIAQPDAGSSVKT